MQRISLLVLVASLLLLGCPGPPAYESIPVEDARALNTHVSAFFSGTTDLLEESSREVGRLASLPDGIRAQDFELQLAKNALMECFNTAINITEVSSEPPRGVEAVLGEESLQRLTIRPDLGLVSACDPNEMESLESYLDYAPEQIGDFIIGRVLTVDTLRVNLKHVLQERLNILEERVLDASGEVVRLRAVSQERFERASSSDGVTESQRRQSEADYEVIQSELDDVERLVGQVSDDLLELRRFRRQLVEDVAVQLAAMGTPGG